MNDHRGVIVALPAATTSGPVCSRHPYLPPTPRVFKYSQPRFTTAFISWWSPRASRISPRSRPNSRPGPSSASTKEEFIQRISNYYKFQTGVGTNILIMTITSFLVGLSIAGQTFYTFVLENLPKFGALKAIGAKNYELVYMIFFQAFFTGCTGYGLGVGLSSLLINIAVRKVPGYAGQVDLFQPRPGLCHVADHYRRVQLRRRQKSHPG